MPKTLHCRGSVESISADDTGFSVNKVDKASALQLIDLLVALINSSQDDDELSARQRKLVEMGAADLALKLASSECTELTRGGLRFLKCLLSNGNAAARKAGPRCGVFESSPRNC